MNKFILRNGLFASVSIVVLFLLIWFIGGESLTYKGNERLGYAAIIFSMLFILIGIKKRRDKDLSGIISFRKAFSTGVFISVFPSVVFGIYTYLFFRIFSDAYIEMYKRHLNEIQKADPATYEIAMRQFEGNAELYTNSGIQAVVMLITVFVIGLAISFLSALILRSK